MNARSLPVSGRGRAGTATGASSGWSGLVSCSHSSSRLESTWRDKLAEPLDDVGDLLGPRRGGHAGPQRLERVGEVAQHRALGAGQPVDADELPEGERPLPHLAHDGLRRQLPVGGPRVALQVHLEGVAEQLLERLRDR